MGTLPGNGRVVYGNAPGADVLRGRGAAAGRGPGGRAAAAPASGGARTGPPVMAAHRRILALLVALSRDRVRRCARRHPASGGPSRARRTARPQGRCSLDAGTSAALLQQRAAAPAGALRPRGPGAGIRAPGAARRARADRWRSPARDRSPSGAPGRRRLGLRLTRGGRAAVRATCAQLPRATGHRGHARAPLRRAAGPAVVLAAKPRHGASASCGGRASLRLGRDAAAAGPVPGPPAGAHRAAAPRRAARRAAAAVRIPVRRRRARGPAVAGRRGDQRHHPARGHADVRVHRPLGGGQPAQRASGDRRSRREPLREDLRAERGDPLAGAVARARSWNAEASGTRWFRWTSAGSLTTSFRRSSSASRAPASLRERLLISATHTHSSTGPIWPQAGYGALGGDIFDPRIFELTAEAVAESIRAAVGDAPGRPRSESAPRSFAMHRATATSSRFSCNEDVP